MMENIKAKFKEVSFFSWFVLGTNLVIFAVLFFLKSQNYFGEANTKIIERVAMFAGMACYFFDTFGFFEKNKNAMASLRMVTFSTIIIPMFMTVIPAVGTTDESLYYAQGAAIGLASSLIAIVIGYLIFKGTAPKSPASEKPAHEEKED